ncbi:dihydrofolate reductase family protein [Kribbia dieselivorans]|uniref:dihydrofolate reductase family protein n=1 Tax=Kribbia dieselivorans TaxID=331526 RepID=UPI0008382551|nr:dihydrofolate reductase family protein [Kribbia dieselivorans]
MRVLLADSGAPWRADADLADDDLLALYAQEPGIRTNTVSTLDGAANGPNGVSDSINTPADNRAFMAMRANCDTILVGAGTVRAEEYGPAKPGFGRPAPLLVVVSGRGVVPATLIPPFGDGDPERGEVAFVTCASAGSEAVDTARAQLGEERVWVFGQDEVDLPAVAAQLATIGEGRVLCEGGPTLFTTLHAAGLVDEVAHTIVPHMIGGNHPRPLQGPSVDTRLALRHLIEGDGSLIGLWRVIR